MHAMSSAMRACAKIVRETLSGNCQTAKQVRVYGPGRLYPALSLARPFRLQERLKHRGQRSSHIVEDGAKILSAEHLASVLLVVRTAAAGLRRCCRCECDSMGVQLISGADSCLTCNSLRPQPPKGSSKKPAPAPAAAAKKSTPAKAPEDGRIERKPRSFGRAYSSLPRHTGPNSPKRRWPRPGRGLA